MSVNQRDSEGVTVTVVLATATGLGGSPDASAACRTVIENTSMTPIVVGVSKVKTSTFTVIVSDCGIEDAEHFFANADFRRDDNKRTTGYMTPSDFDGECWTFTGTTRWNPRSMDNSYAGSWSPLVSAWGSSQDEAYTQKFWVQRAARATTNATPEPIKKGRKITVNGTLTRASWDTNTYRPYLNQTVDLEFRTANGSYEYVKSATTNFKGNLRTTVTARRDGCYRYVYTGHSTTRDAISAGDCIDVR